MKGMPINHHLVKDTRTLFTCLMLILLSGFSFYLGIIFCSQRSLLSINQFFAPLQTAVVFRQCDIDYQDYTPCTDPRRWDKYGYHRRRYMERHCPLPFERKECLVPPPNGYRPPIRWPKSKNKIWYQNVPYDRISIEKSDQNWLEKEGDKFIFPGGGTMFPNGVNQYVDLMEELIPEMEDGTVRTAIDTGCGVASWGSELMDRGILTVSLAPRDNHEAQIQFALERGLPAILGILSTQRLPFPSSSFDMAHCSRCLIPWTEFGGIYLMEVQRILRPGGLWVLSGPPVNYEKHCQGWNTTEEEQKKSYNKLLNLLTSLCFELYNNKDDISVWKKSSNDSCYNQLRKENVYPPACDDSTDPDTAWYTPLRPCVSVPDPKLERTSLDSIPKWPNRLIIAPERVSDVSKSNGSRVFYKRDLRKWKKRAKYYKKMLPALGTDQIRNVMDMKTLYGGLAAMLEDDPVWVMNVVSPHGPNTLPVIYDRGLIGAYHDWCEAFSTYPRTYDLLHADGIFSTEHQRCDVKYVLLEMDRILRPTGYAIIRESNYFVDLISVVARGMRWECSKEDARSAAENEKILICQKTLWYSQKSSIRPLL